MARRRFYQQGVTALGRIFVVRAEAKIMRQALQISALKDYMGSRQLCGSLLHSLAVAMASAECGQH